MNTSEYAPRTSGSAASADSSMVALPGPSPAGSRSAAAPANSAVRMSVSLVAPGPPAPAAGSTSAASSLVLIRLPLCPRARLADGVARNVGWAFSHTEAPDVEYRQCPIARCPRSVFSAPSSNTCGTRPMSLTTTIVSPLLTAIPADSWPRCCSAYRPK